MFFGKSLILKRYVQFESLFHVGLVLQIGTLDPRCDLIDAVSNREIAHAKHIHFTKISCV